MANRYCCYVYGRNQSNSAYKPTLIHWHIIEVNLRSIQLLVDDSFMSQMSKNISITRLLFVTVIRIFDKTDLMMV